MGNPLVLSLTGGQVHDITQAETLAAQIGPQALLADQGYDSDGFIESLEVRAIKAVIPPNSNRKVKRDCDFALYCERNLVERFFNIPRLIDDPKRVLPLRLGWILFAGMIRPGFLSSAERSELRALARDGLGAARAARRANAIVLLNDGWSCEEVATALHNRR